MKQTVEDDNGNIHYCEITEHRIIDAAISNSMFKCFTCRDCLNSDHVI